MSRVPASIEGMSLDMLNNQGKMHIQIGSEEEKYADVQLSVQNRESFECLRPLQHEQLMTNVPRLLNLSASKP